MLTSAGRRLIDSAPCRSLIDAIETHAKWPADRLTVLTYHRIDDVLDDGRYPGLISATPAEFAAQIAVLVERYNVVSIETVLDALRGGALPDRAVLLTFDDAVSDFERHALPVLAEHDAPGVVFVPTGFVGDQDTWFWWDAIHAAVTRTDQTGVEFAPLGFIALETADDRRSAYRSLRDHCLALDSREAADVAATVCDLLGVNPPPANVMNWTQLRALSAAGIACCPHSRSHAHLDHLDAERLDSEIEGSFSDMSDQLDHVPPAFAYPAGLVSDAVVAATRRAGIDVAFTTERGANRLRQVDPLRLRRINVSRRSGLGAIRLQLQPVSDRLTGGLGRRMG